MSKPMLSAAQQSALQNLLERLQAHDLVWALTGSTSFVLQGLPVIANDIDIQTDAAGAYAIEQLLAENMVKPVTFSAVELIQSHYGGARFDGVDIDIMGAVQKRLPDGSWDAPVDVQQHRRWVQWQQYRVPVLDLAYESQAYRQLGRLARADLLAEFVADQQKDQS